MSRWAGMFAFCVPRTACGVSRDGAEQSYWRPLSARAASLLAGWPGPGAVAGFRGRPRRSRLGRAVRARNRHGVSPVRSAIARIPADTGGRADQRSATLPDTPALWAPGRVPVGVRRCCEEGVRGGTPVRACGFGLSTPGAVPAGRGGQPDACVRSLRGRPQARPPRFATAVVTQIPLAYIGRRGPSWPAAMDVSGWHGRRGTARNRRCTPRGGTAGYTFFCFPPPKAQCPCLLAVTAGPQHRGTRASWGHRRRQARPSLRPCDPGPRAGPLFPCRCAGGPRTPVFSNVRVPCFLFRERSSC